MSAFDVAIWGAGPAGSTCALQLARLGHSVLLLHQDPRRTQPGEALPPAANRLLRELGVMHQFTADRHCPCFGNQSAWGSDDLHSTDFMYSPDGHGWHVDRARFDEMLRQHAIAAGVVLGSPKASYSSRWTVDCTGRGSALARSKGRKRLAFDRLIGFLMFVYAKDADADPEMLTIIEAVESGWWYTARLPQGLRLVAYYTDGKNAAAMAARTAEGLRALLAETRHIAARVPGVRSEEPPLVMPANSSCLDHAAGDGWIAAGDAAAAHDPLSSLGISAALITAIRAADAVHSAICGDKTAIHSYCDWMQEAFRRYLLERASQYASEGRWRDSPFWRRHAAEPVVGLR